MGFRQILTVGALALKQIWDCVQTQPVHAQIEPEIHGGKHGFAHLRIFPVEVRLVCIKSVPVISLGHGVPGPVGAFKVFKNDARVAIPIRRIAPNVKISPSAAGRSMPRTLKPEVLVRRMVEHQFRDHFQPATLRLAHEALKIL
jgi:hypothetical protein